jgi:hypothetical protein
MAILLHLELPKVCRMLLEFLCPAGPVFKGYAMNGFAAGLFPVAIFASKCPTVIVKANMKLSIVHWYVEIRLLSVYSRGAKVLFRAQITNARAPRGRCFADKVLLKCHNDIFTCH